MIYLDNAATTKIKKEVLDEMMPYLTDCYGNASAVYSLAAGSRNAIDRARDAAARLLSTDAGNIYFTSGGSESDNWAIKMAALYPLTEHGGKHIITTRIEHPAVINTCKALENMGFEVTYVPVDRYGYVEPSDIEAAVRKDTVLISVMTANNEIGTIEPVAETGRIARQHGVIFHTDAVQAFGQIPINPEEMNIDLLSASSHKLYGPKGTGLLYVGSRASGLRSFINGGSQERNKRAGTENTAGIAGFGKACELALKYMDQRALKEKELRDHMIQRILSEIPHSVLNGPAVDQDSDVRRLPNNVNISFPGNDSQTLLIRLDMAGICASAGSACAAGAPEPSHVLRAIAVSDEQLNSTLRFSLSDDTTLEEIDSTVDVLRQIVK